MSDILKHPLLGQAYRLGLAIEQCGASEELTNASVLSSDLMRGIEVLVDEMIKYRLVVDLIIRRNKLMNPEICLDMLDKAAKQAIE